MALVDTITHIKKTIGRYSSELPELQRRTPALAAYASVDTLLAALDTSSPLGHAERGRLVAALVRDHQDEGGELPQRLLIIAFERALLGVRRRLGYRNRKSVDLDQRVLLCFLEVLKKRSIVNAGEYAPIALSRETQKAVFGGIKSVRKKAIPTAEFKDETYVAGELFERQNDKSAARIEQAQRFLDLASEELHDMLVRTIAGNESLMDYVERALPGADANQRKLAYERLKSQRYEALLSIRAIEGSDPS